MAPPRAVRCDRWRKTCCTTPQRLLKFSRTCGDGTPPKDAKLDALLRAAHRRRTRTRRCLVFTQFADTVRLPGRAVRGTRRAAARPASPATAKTRPRSPGASARSATRSATGLARGRTARAGRHRCAQRGPEPQDCCHRRQLRSALGDHPPHPAGRPRGPHRPEGRERSSATRSCPPTASSGSSACAPASGSACSENAEVVGTDEAFFEDDEKNDLMLDLYHEKAGILDGEADDRGRPGLLRLPDLEERHRREPGAGESHPGSCPTWSIRTQGACSLRRPAPEACSSTCAPPRATTRWPGSTATATASPNRSSRSSRPPSAPPTRRRCRAHDHHHELVQRRRASSSKRRRPSAGNSAGHPAPASAPTSG